METSNDDKLLDLKEASEFIKIKKENIRGMTEEKTIPHSVLPDGTLVFSRNRLYHWVLSLDQTSHIPVAEIASKKMPTDIPSFARIIIKRFGYNHKARLAAGYLNLYKGQRAFAQLHFPSSYGGIDLALWERGNDKDLPKCSVLKRVDELWKLSGYQQRNNKAWLDGERLSNSPAAAFNIPQSLYHDSGDPGWKELEALLKYTFGKR